MKILRKIICAICVFALITTFTGCAETKFSEKETKYFVVYSDILNSNGLLCGIDEDGNYTSSKKIKLQDGTKTKLIDGKTIIGGGRANTHIIVDADGGYNEFYLLDEPNYTGVCAITLNGDRIISSMNGGFSEGVYLNLFVVQDLSGNVEIKDTIEIYAEDIICVDNMVYIVGAMDYAGADEGWIGKIIAYNLDTRKITEQQFETQKPFLNIQLLNDKLYCSVRPLNNDCREIYVIDRYTLEKVGCLTFNKNIEGLLAYDNRLYCAIGEEFCEISPDNGDVVNRLYALPNGSYIENSTAADGSIYITTRFDTPLDGENDPIVGTQAKYKLSDGTVSEIPIPMDRKKYSFFVLCPIT